MPSRVRMRYLQLGAYALASLLVGTPATAQTSDARSASGSLSASGNVVLTNVLGLASGTIQISGTYNGTFELQCTAQFTAAGQFLWEQDDEVGLVRYGTSTTVTSVSGGAVGLWVFAAPGCNAVRLAYTHTSGTIVASLSMVQSGGGSAGGGGGGSSFDGVLLDAAGGDALTDTVNNALRVNIIAGAGSGGTAIADDAAFTVGTTNLTPAGGIYRSSRDQVDDNDTGAFAMTIRRALYAAFETPNGDSMADDTNDALKVVNATAANFNVTIGAAIAAGTNNIGDVDVLTVPADPFGANADSAATAGSTGSIQAKLRLMTSQLDAIKSAVETLDNAISGSGINVSQIGGTAATVDPAHDAADSGTGPKLTVKAVALGANPTGVAAGDRTDAYGIRSGQPLVLAGHPNIITREAQVEDADGAQTNAAIITVSGGTMIVVTMIEASCDAANTSAINIAVGFGASALPSRAHGGTSGILFAFDGVPPGGGKVKGSGAGIIGIGADGEDLRLTMEDPAGGSCSVIVTYFTVEG